LALFREGAPWRRAYALPFLIFLAYFVLRYAWSGSIAILGAIVHQLLVGLLLAHVVSLALTDLRNDLVDARRRFRIAVALILPCTGFIIVAAELYSLQGDLPAWLGRVQAASLLALSFIFALWLTEGRQDLIAAAAAPQPASGALTPAELIELERLKPQWPGASVSNPSFRLETWLASLDFPSIACAG
jgi:hypothetical protein